jgi:pimeloyl-ACP methyl ester carboxylesterase
VAEGLSDEYHVLAPDLLGWGGTDKVVFFDRSPYAPRIKHVSDFLDAVGAVDDAFFVGASFGGSMTLRALADPSSPWRASKAATISGTGGPFRLASGIKALGEYEPSIEAAERLTSLVVASVEGLDQHIKQRYENSLIPGHWEAMSAPKLRNPGTERALPPDPFPNSLKTVSTPILYVEGIRDQLLEPGWSAKLCELTPNGSRVEVEYAHEPNIDAPGEIVRILKTFFKGDSK